MKTILLRVLWIAAGLAVLAGVAVVSFQLGWKHGALNTISLDALMAIRTGEALAAGDLEKTRKLVTARIEAVEAGLLSSDDATALPAFRLMKCRLLVDLDDYWKTHPRNIHFGDRVDESNVEEYGLIGGRTINESRAAYETAYSNAVREARKRLKMPEGSLVSPADMK